VGLAEQHEELICVQNLIHIPDMKTTCAPSSPKPDSMPRMLSRETCFFMVDSFGASKQTRSLDFVRSNSDTCESSS